MCRHTLILSCKNQFSVVVKFCKQRLEVKREINEFLNPKWQLWLWVFFLHLWDQKIFSVMKGGVSSKVQVTPRRDSGD